MGYPVRTRYYGLGGCGVNYQEGFNGSEPASLKILNLLQHHPEDQGKLAQLKKQGRSSAVSSEGAGSSPTGGATFIGATPYAPAAIRDFSVPLNLAYQTSVTPPLMCISNQTLN